MCNPASLGNDFSDLSFWTRDLQKKVDDFGSWRSLGPDEFPKCWQESRALPKLQPA